MITTRLTVLLFLLLGFIGVTPAMGLQFESIVSYPIRGGAIGVTHGDFDGDGFVDVAVGNNSVAQATVLYGTLSGQLVSPVEIPNGNNAVLDLAAADFNGDGRDELVFPGTGGNIAVASGETNRTFSNVSSFFATSNSSDVDIVDLDNDGQLDIIASGRRDASQFILYGNENGTFADSIIVQGSGLDADLVVADFNRDGFADIASSTNSPSFAVNSGTADRDVFNLAEFPIDGGAVIGLVTGDFNSDSIPDLAYTVRSEEIQIALGAGDGTFDQRFTFDAPLFLIALETGDFDGDGILDLAGVTRNDSTIGVFSGVGDGTFLRQDDLFASANGTSSLDVFDLNGDGLDDIVVAAASGSNVDVFLATAAVPEPSSTVAILISLVGFTCLRRKQQTAG